MNLAAFASGKGTVLAALIDAKLPICVVLVDRLCEAAVIANDAQIPVEIVERGDFSLTFDRNGYTTRVVQSLESHRVDVIAMAGFMTVLDPPIHERYPDRILNTHPSLLPDFKGPHAVRDALAAGIAVTGCTVHVATREVDEGPILAQQQVPVLPGDTEASLHERIKQVERTLYPGTIRNFLDDLDQSGGLS